MRYVESHIQKSIVAWFRAQYPEIPIFSIPNGAKRSKIQGKRLKDEGLMPGAADLFIANQTLIVSDHGCGLSNGLFIEVKTDKGRQSEDQKIFQKKVENLGYSYFIVRSLDQFINTYNLIKL
jgi:hypothetical protein